MAHILTQPVKACGIIGTMVCVGEGLLLGRGVYPRGCLRSEFSSLASCTPLRHYPGSLKKMRLWDSQQVSVWGVQTESRY